MQSSYSGVALPKNGKPIEYPTESTIPDNPIIPYIEGDGIGRDIWHASERVFDAAVEKAYGGKRAVESGLRFSPARKHSGNIRIGCPMTPSRLPRFRVSIKGPLTTPVGGGIRSFNVALRQILDLYSCVRPVKYYQGVPSPVKHPEKLDIVIYRENTEDVYAGIEFKEGLPKTKKDSSTSSTTTMLKGTKKSVRTDSGVGIKPISITGTKRLVRVAIKPLR